ncbi:hypothetical protein GRF59_01110 [Paenibacillus sp. HJL G12]|uniref:Uncharacterized protein n=1 Tax=Paenibacillus dendrobii TaxID=2691084 RepID=A0A7X3LEQ0_9BACL|nr:hypothetical protein [Paenibacillus dendrobii]MWV42217.1 hypothetical protein [Paenibacillus dendrobii]
MKIKSWMVVFLLSSIMMGGCENISTQKPHEIFSADQAIALVVQTENKDDFPAKTGTNAGVIKGGGPQPGIRVPGTFTSSATKQSGDVYLVTLKESWSAKDFRTENKPEKAILSYFWTYEVTPTTVKPLNQGGDFPPDHVE